MAKIERTDYLALYGKSTIENGYNIVPIPPKSKAPDYDGWQKTRATQKTLTDWVADGMGHFGIGILTKHTPAIDLDISDEKVLKKVLDWIEFNITDTPFIRVGRAPRALLLFRTDEPFRKMKTGKYEDEWGDRHEIEVLGDGQQFVAYALHKDTGKPYEWTTDREPISHGVTDLPVLTQEEVTALFEYYEQIVAEEGWKKVTNGLSGGVRSIDDDDPFADVESVIDITTEDLRDRLLTIGNAEDYERWVQIGMALFHQFGGSDEGLALWHEWSEVADNYEPDALEKHWASFDIAGKKRAPITARLIVKLAREEATTLAVKRVAEFKDSFLTAKDVIEWKAVCSNIRKTEIDSIARAEISEVARKRYQDITGAKLPIVEVRKALAYEMSADAKVPKWCRDWVYDSESDRFFHVRTKITMTMQGFNAVHSRMALTKKDIAEGLTEPKSPPSALALNLYSIPTVSGTRYAPGQDILFFEDGVKRANTYPEYQIPETPEELTPKDKRAINIVKRHIVHLLEDEHEQRLMLNWLAWIVQNPGKLLKWAMVFQGVEGDGKSFFGFLLRAVMGTTNVKMMNASIIESNFTGWAVGQCVVVIEEPRLHGQNKYDVINRIKPLITNAVIEVHPKGKDPYNVVNTSNYFLPTNFRDALPINDNDRRYCVLFSRWQSRQALIKFNLENPDYYSDLYRAIEECAPALRKWLCDHEIDSDFMIGGDAPRTKAHAYMVAASNPEPIRVIQEIIAEGQHHDITEDLVNATALPDAMIGRDGDIPGTSGLSRLLEHAGYVLLGRIKIDGVPGRFWSRSPDKFKSNGEVDTKAIRAYLKKSKQKIEENEL